MSTVTVSTKIICPDCGTRMAKKNWKDHARQKHTMTEDTIQTKYEQLRPSSSCALFDKPTPIAINNFFSRKKIAVTTSNSEQSNLHVEIGDAETIIINDGTDASTLSKDISSPQGNIHQFPNLKVPFYV